MATDVSRRISRSLCSVLEGVSRPRGFRDVPYAAESYVLDLRRNAECISLAIAGLGRQPHLHPSELDHEPLLCQGTCENCTLAFRHPEAHVPQGQGSRPQRPVPILALQQRRWGADGPRDAEAWESSEEAAAIVHLEPFFSLIPTRNSMSPDDGRSGDCVDPHAGGSADRVSGTESGRSFFELELAAPS